MNREFVNYEQALELKDLGFDEPCFGYFNTSPYLGIGSFVFKECDKSTIDAYGNKPLLRPTFSQAFRWFREKHGLLFWIEPSFKNQYQTDGYVYYVKNNGSYSIDYATYEQAEIACLNKLIEILKNKQ